MDFLLEALIQAIIEIVVQLLGLIAVEAALEGVAHALANRIGRLVIGTSVGLAFGVAWGTHLNGQSHWPRLLWVSLAFAVIAVVLAMGRDGAQQEEMPGWRSLLVPPWRWSRDRLIGLVLINAGIAIGIVLSFRPQGA